MQSLRTELQNLTLISDVHQHRDLLERLSKKIPNSIRILESSHSIDLYTCFVYAFEFTNDPIYLGIASFGLGRVFASPDFVRYMIEKGYLYAVDCASVSKGNLIIYYRDGGVTHGGKFDGNGRVVSKWGIGHLYEHDILEVPECYGNEFRCYKEIATEKALNYFREYAEHMGLEFE
jgi:hypothetical protein